MLTVVIPTKNRVALLRRAIESVRKQSNDIQIIIVNDGSTDGTESYLDSLRLNDPHVTVITNVLCRGVNVSRNKAVRFAGSSAWCVFLDDDDEFISGAIATIESTITIVPNSISVLLFATQVTTPQATYAGGYKFMDVHTQWYAPSYFEIFTKSGLSADCNPVIRASLITSGRYAFAEDVNGFESEFFSLLARDGIGIRYYRAQTIHVDRSHEGEHLSNAAAARNPSSFVRVHRRMLYAHRSMLEAHPKLLRARTRAGIKVAVRAGDLGALVFFCFYWFRSFF